MVAGKKILKFSSLSIILGLWSHVSWALIPLESLILGDLSQLLLERKSDPIQYILRPDYEDNATKESFRRFLAIFRGHYAEGANLKNSCLRRPKLVYPEFNQEIQVKRSVMASMQYIGLDLSARAIAAYAKQLSFSEDEWNNLASRLVQNYCSNNLTIISKKQLRKNIDLYFAHGSGLQLPTVSGNPLFPKLLGDSHGGGKALEREFLYSVSLFRSMCSWGNEVDNPRLLVPFLRNPTLMAYVIRNLTDNELAFNAIDSTVYLNHKKEAGPKVWCRNLICRKRDSLEFNQAIFRAIGSKNLKDDLESLYCHFFRDLDFQTKDQVAEIKKWIDTSSFDDFNFQQGQFIALLTGVPDFLLRVDNFSKSIEFMRTSMDQTWDEWAKRQLNSFGRDLYYEEPLSVELVDRALYFNPFSDKFKVVFDVNLGEIDRVNRIVGKIRAKFTLNIHRQYLSWLRSRWLNLDPRKTKERDYLVKTMVHHIEDQVKEGRKSFILPPWDGNLENIIAEEIIDQLALYKGKQFQNIKGMMEIPVELNYGPFALKYLHYEAQLKKETQNLDYSSYEYSD